MTTNTQLLFQVDGKDRDGNDVKVDLAVKSPSAAVHQKAGHYRLVAYSEAARNNALIRQELDILLEKKNLWGEDKQAKSDSLRNFLVASELSLKTAKTADGVRLKLSEAKAIALQMRKSRNELVELLSVRNEIDINTADAIADNARFNYMVAACTVYMTRDDRFGKPYFTTDGEHPSVENYIERMANTDAYTAASKFAELQYGSTSDSLSKLPEIEFLRKYKFIDEDFHLIDSLGRKIDESGRLVDKEGYYINEQGERVDINGNRVDENGEYLTDGDAFFLDDDGNPIPEETPLTVVSDTE